MCGFHHLHTSRELVIFAAVFVVLTQMLSSDEGLLAQNQRKAITVVNRHNVKNDSQPDPVFLPRENPEDINSEQIVGQKQDLYQRSRQLSQCDVQKPIVVYPFSSVKRREHMTSIVNRIDGCGLEISAVMADRVESHTTQHVLQGISSDYTTILYEGNTLFKFTGKIPRGNLPNAATHFKMMRAIAESSTAISDTNWVVIFEDDAQLHANISNHYDLPHKVANLLRWSFEIADAHGFSMINYGICKGRYSRCVRLPTDDLTSKHENVELSTCSGDFRCAQAYAVQKQMAQRITNAHDVLNSGGTDCPVHLTGGPSCSKDPFAFVNVLSLCRNQSVMNTGWSGCRALVVGTNFVAPTAHPVKKDHVGIFVQEKTKDFVKHYKVKRLGAQRTK